MDSRQSWYSGQTSNDGTSSFLYPQDTVLGSNGPANSLTTDLSTHMFNNLAPDVYQNNMPTERPLGWMGMDGNLNVAVDEADEANDSFAARTFAPDPIMLFLTLITDSRMAPRLSCAIELHPNAGSVTSNDDIFSISAASAISLAVNEDLPDNIRLAFRDAGTILATARHLPMMSRSVFSLPDYRILAPVLEVLTSPAYLFQLDSVPNGDHSHSTVGYLARECNFVLILVQITSCKPKPQALNAKTSRQPLSNLNPSLISSSNTNYWSGLSITPSSANHSASPNLSSGTHLSFSSSTNLSSGTNLSSSTNLSLGTNLSDQSLDTIPALGTAHEFDLPNPSSQSVALTTGIDPHSADSRSVLAPRNSVAYQQNFMFVPNETLPTISRSLRAKKGIRFAEPYVASKQSRPPKRKQDALPPSHSKRFAGSSSDHGVLWPNDIDEACTTFELPKPHGTKGPQGRNRLISVLVQDWNHLRDLIFRLGYKENRGSVSVQTCTWRDGRVQTFEQILSELNWTKDDFSMKNGIYLWARTATATKVWDFSRVVSQADQKLEATLYEIWKRLHYFFTSTSFQYDGDILLSEPDSLEYDLVNLHQLDIKNHKENIKLRLIDRP
ncbi:hypothetical protein C8R42DRAFT_720760 [Lentinula raphanica]|nr:hypothetical protein C8R42DRAFT_720760 [Lentinula raphanica]